MEIVIKTTDHDETSSLIVSGTAVGLKLLVKNTTGGEHYVVVDPKELMIAIKAVEKSQKTT